MRRELIGVVGGNEVERPTWLSAKRVGRSIAVEGGVLLTGGEPVEDEPDGKWEVKKAAMCGAERAEREGLADACYIGILPGMPTVPKPSPTRWLIRTGLSSFQRNPINGMTPDTVLVFEGQLGTLTELGFALASEKKVFFVNAIDPLRRVFARTQEKLSEKLDVGIEQCPIFRGKNTADHIIAMIDTCLANTSEEDPLPDCAGEWPDYENDNWARALVTKILESVTSQDLENPPDFPGIGEEYPAKDFADWYREMPMTDPQKMRAAQSRAAAAARKRIAEAAL